LGKGLRLLIKLAIKRLNMKLKSLTVLVALVPTLVIAQVIVNPGASAGKPAGMLPTPMPQTAPGATKQTGTISSSISTQDTGGMGQEANSTSSIPCTDYGSVQDCNKASKTKSE
jgi:hypothetical protein